MKKEHLKKDKTPLPLKVVRWLYPNVEKTFPSLAHRYFIHLFFTPFRYVVPEKDKVLEQQAEQSMLEVAGKKIQVYSWGSGPIILVVHGWAGRASQFRKFIPVFNHSGYRVVGFDGPAHGRSAGKQTNLIEFDLVISQIVKTMGQPVAIIAHSFGGVASLYSIMNGLGTKKVINISSPTIGDEIVNTYLKAIQGSQATAEAFKSYMLKTFHKSFDEFSALHIIKHVPADLKLLLIHDDQDKEVTIDHPLALLKIYPSALFHKTSGLGHTRILKDDDIINLCLDFVKF
ncbi:MAG TPA: alpha/beta hydrolase [Cyclobacteriaceae bacterium]|nr:alpha/beta hydrolase [Cyclobacteriaceae bacterium]